MRTIKFRAYVKSLKKFYPVENLYLEDEFISLYDSNINLGTSFKVKNNEVELMQFTGITDKNGKEIYEGDILQHYAFKRYTQQSHPDVRPEIDELVIGGPFIDKVVFTHGCFTLSKEFNEEEFPFISPLSQFGFYSVERVKEDLFEDMDLDEKEKETDCNGVEINESIIGIEIIGNIHENPELLDPR